MTNLVALPGSYRRPLPGAQVISGADPQQSLESVSIYFRPMRTASPLPDIVELSARAPGARVYLTDADVAAIVQPDANAVARFQGFLADHGITAKPIAAPHPNHAMRVTGNVGAFDKAFGVTHKRYAHPSGTYRGRTGPLYVPAEFVPCVHSIFGLDNRRMGYSYVRSVPALISGSKQPFVPTQLAPLYDFPANLDGTGQTVAILAFNGQLADTGQTAPGGYSLTALQSYFTKLGVPLPQIQNVVVHGPGNTPGDGTNPEDVSGEVMLDIQMVGLLAPGAKIVVYFSEFTEAGWVDVIHAVLSDTVNSPSILSCSYGNAETASDASDANTRGSLWTNAAITQTDLAFQLAAGKGMTVFCASGDNGSPDGDNDGLAHCDYPASSAYVTGVGGTSLIARNGVIARESVWNDGPGSAGGGGVSALFPLPSYQDDADVPASVNPGHAIGRGVPDVAADADPSTGLLIVDNSGEQQQIGGTSAAAPLWAALAARINQGLSSGIGGGTKIGFLNPMLYGSLASGVLNDITKGNNGSYRAGPGWDACSGLGSPDGNRLLQGLSAPTTASASAGSLNGSGGGATGSDGGSVASAVATDPVANSALAA
jgi:kumamolisin